MPGEIIRRYGFWLADALQGGLVRRYYKNLKNMPGAAFPSSDLQALLHHAVMTTPYYAPWKNSERIESFPVINKQIILAHYDGFLSSVYRREKLHVMRSSGSSGDRFAMLQNRKKRKRVLAELIYFNEQSGFQMGERFIYTRIWFKDNRKSIWMRTAENMCPFDCRSLSDASLDGLFHLLQKDKSIKMLKGYASSLEAIADYFDRRGFSPALFNLKIILSGAERLDQVAKAKLKHVFGCPVISRYSNQENGVLAQQGSSDDIFYLNTPHYYFEWLKLDDDTPAAIGESARLIITDLYNLAMPMIRYDTGDIVIAGQVDGVPGRNILLDVSGRCDEVITDTRGNKISPHAVALHFRQFTGLRQYQLIQNSRTDFVLKLEAARGVYDDTNVKQSLSGLVGADCAIEIIHLDKIPQAASGKLKKIIRNY
jgi:phenylacetate-CoA ligase